jgi:hypothetical protein
MYFEDLTPYQYLSDATDKNSLNVGWLDRKYLFNKGEPTEYFLDKLFKLCKSPVNQTCGFHQCPFCVSGKWGVEEVRNGQTINLGSAEIRVTGLNGIAYAAPDLIYHYVKQHHYLPPEEFIKAVLL